MSFHLVLWLRHLGRISREQWLTEATKERVLELTYDFQRNDNNPGAFLNNEPRS